MAFSEWRKFHFFDLQSNVDDGIVAELFKDDCRITVTSSGNNSIVLGDSSGQVHLVNRSWNIHTYRAYELSTDFLYQLRNSSLLVTVGQDEPGVNPLIKIWDTGRLDKNGSPHCFRVSRALPGNRPVQVSALCVHENLQLMALGFIDGSLMLFRGDITRERSSKQKLLRDASSAVTGLAFKTTSTSIYLFLATDSSVLVYNITQKDKEERVHLDNIGCAKRCCVLAESIQESHFMVGRNDAVYCYTTDGRGPCYAIDGEKVMSEWFRSYLIIISKTNRPMAVNSVSNGNQSSILQGDCITVLDIHNKFIVFSATMPKIKAVSNEFGSFYISDEDNKVYHSDEKDSQSKLSSLFKKNSYDVSIRIAKSQQYDTEGLVDIFKQYGDHSCNKGDYTGAIDQYIKTIGKSEPSYVIRKFSDSQHIEKLTLYLQALHKERQATEDHTTSLLNCYTKLSNTSGQNEGLKQFILSKDSDSSYDVDVAIKVCRQGSPSEALMLAKRHEKHDWYIKLSVEDHQKYVEVSDYISGSSFENAELYMKKYGNISVQKVPNESTQFSKKSCTNYKPNDASIISENASTGSYDMPVHAEPEDFIHLFSNNSERLVEFLEYVIEEGSILTTPVYNTSSEHYSHVWTNSQGEKTKWCQKISKSLQNPDIKYDKSQASVVCHMHSFSDGISYSYEEQKSYQQILRHHITRNDSGSVSACCRRFGNQEPTLWVQALWSCVRDTKNPPPDSSREILTVIAKERLLSPQSVIDALGSETTDITVGHIKEYITKGLKQEEEKTSEITDSIENYRKDIDKLRKQSDTLKSGAIVIQGSRCAACHHPSESPTVHFLCQHSYHQHCFQSFCDEDQGCPACQPGNKNLSESSKAREHSTDSNETFHSQSEKAHDGYSVAAEYFGRGVFNRYKDITDKAVKKLMESREEEEQLSRTLIPRTEREVRDYGYGAEAKMRQTEKKQSQSIVHTSEGRMRQQETGRYGSSVKSNSGSYERKKDAGNPGSGFNPFESEYDPSNNPFENEEESEEEGNPFRSSYDCDKNLNPFS